MRMRAWPTRPWAQRPTLYSQTNQFPPNHFGNTSDRSCRDARIGRAVDGGFDETWGMHGITLSDSKFMMTLPASEIVVGKVSGKGPGRHSGGRIFWKSGTQGELPRLGIDVFLFRVAREGIQASHALFLAKPPEWFKVGLEAIQDSRIPQRHEELRPRNRHRLDRGLARSYVADLNSENARDSLRGGYRAENG